MKKPFVAASASIIFFVLLYFMFFWREQAPIRYVDAVGIIEATEVELSSEVGKRIEWLCCKEGDAVKAGAPAVRLNDKEERARLEEAEAAVKEVSSAVKVTDYELEEANAQMGLAEAGIRASEAQTKRLKTLLDDAKKELERASSLFKEGVASEREFDSAKTRHDALGLELNAVKAELDSSVSALKGAEARVKTINARRRSVEAKLEEARARVKLFQAALKDTVIESPIDGIVVHKAFEPGETAPAQASIYTIHDTEDVWARVEVEETEVSFIKLGARAEIFLEALKDKGIFGEVSEIGRIGEFATQRDAKRGRPDIKTFKVKVRVKEKNGILKPGMTIRVRIY